jgi:Mitochondrial carrier protein
MKFDSLVTSFAALVASILSWTLIVPFDVVKTNMQCETNPNIHKNMVECLHMLIRTHNHKALFSGLYMNIAKSYAALCGFQYCLNKCQQNVLENKH